MSVRHDWSIEDYDEYRKRLVRECQQRRRMKAKSIGLCATCCRRKAKPGCTTCQVCIDKAIRYQAQRRATTE